MTETLNYSITILGAKNQILSSKWSLLIVLFYFTALQVDHTHERVMMKKAQQHCMKDCGKCWKC